MVISIFLAHTTEWRKDLFVLYPHMFHCRMLRLCAMMVTLNYLPRIWLSYIRLQHHAQVLVASDIESDNSMYIMQLFRVYWEM